MPFNLIALDDLVVGNLGCYQEIVELAKKSGGVDAMIKTIEDGAVADAAPTLVSVGLAAGVVLTVVASKSNEWAKRVIVTRRTAVQDGYTVEQHIRDAVDDANQASASDDNCVNPGIEDVGRSTNEQPTSAEGDDYADRS